MVVHRNAVCHFPASDEVRVLRAEGRKPAEGRVYMDPAPVLVPKTSDGQ